MAGPPTEAQQRWVDRHLGVRMAGAEVPTGVNPFSRGFAGLALPEWDGAQPPRPLADVKGAVLARRKATAEVLGGIDAAARQQRDAVRTYIDFYNRSDAACTQLAGFVGKSSDALPRYVSAGPTLTVELPDGSVVSVSPDELGQCIEDRRLLESKLGADLEDAAVEEVHRKRGVDSNPALMQVIGEELQAQHPGIDAEPKADIVVRKEFDRALQALFDARLADPETQMKQVPENKRQRVADALQRYRALAAKLAQLTQARRDLDAQVTLAKQPLQDRMHAIVDCLPVLDAPENNPERAEVLTQRQALAALADQPVAQQFGALRTLERTLHEWVDRRTQQHLPPPREALALLDVLRQQEATLLQQVIEAKTPLPLPEGVDPAEAEQAQSHWAALRDGGGVFQVAPADAAGGPYNALWKRGHAVPLPAEGERVAFRNKALVTFAKLLQAEAGRSLVAGLAQATHKVSVVQAGSGAGSIDLGGNGGHVVMVQPEYLDGDAPGISTRTGDPLLSPGTVLLGHELVHALHDVRNEGRRHLPLEDAKPEWGNPEELETILKGGLSEQTLRHQYGLTAERFGHVARSPQRMGNAVARQLEQLAVYEGADGGQRIDTELRDSGFDPGSMDVAQRVELHALINGRPIRGPLPAGWKPVQLSAAQIVGIVQHDGGKGLPYRLDALGWPPYGLPVDGGVAHPQMGGAQSLVAITQTGMAHPRSPAGRRFVELGGRPAFDAQDRFPIQLRGLAPWNAAQWSANLQALERWRAGWLELPDLDPEVRDLLRATTDAPALLAQLQHWADRQRVALNRDLDAHRDTAAPQRALCAALREANDFKAVAETLRRLSYGALEEDVLKLPETQWREFLSDSILNDTVAPAWYQLKADADVDAFAAQAVELLLPKIEERTAALDAAAEPLMAPLHQRLAAIDALMRV